MNAILVRIGDAFAREPLAITKGVVYLVTAVLDAAIAFGAPLSADQKGALIVVVTAGLQLLGDFVARSQVTPVADPRIPNAAVIPGHTFTTDVEWTLTDGVATPKAATK